MQHQEVWKQKVDLFRKRFGAREDVFGVKQTYFKTVKDKETGEVSREEVSIFSPQCENFGNQLFCQISSGAGGCAGCQNRKYQRLTDEWVWKHISGSKDLLPYMVTKDGIKFGACDFDYGSHFEDATLVRDFSRKLGLPCYIARSSKKGYHLYWFFREFVPGHLFTSFVGHIYGHVGFLARYQENMSVPLPEVFPKQTNFEEGRQGNGIKVPMIEPKIREGFNCWVDDAARPLPFEEQWDYFRNMEEITLEQLQKVIEEHQITIIQAPVSRSGRNAKRRANGGPSGPIQPRGDFWKVIDSCPALKQFWEKDVDGTYKFDKTSNEHGVPHMARVASLSIAASTVNGADAIRDRWSSRKTEDQIQYAVMSRQHPWTCRAMQDQGLCKVGIHPKNKDRGSCLKKIPPVEIQNGIWVQNPNQLPESEWAEPSPCRFASGYMTQEQILEDLNGLFSYRKIKARNEDGSIKKDERGNEIEIIDKNAVPPPDLDERVYALLKASKRLSPDEQKAVQTHIKANKYVPAKELSSLDRRITQEEKAEEHRDRCKEQKHFDFGGNTFILDDNHYLMSYLDAKGIRNEVDLTNFTVEVKEEIVVLNSIEGEDGKDERVVEDRAFKGNIKVGTKNYGFRCRVGDWIRSGETFFSFLTTHAGGDLLYNKSNYDHIRNCINHFSKDTKIIRRQVKDFGHYKIKGEHTFITPSVVVTKDQIRPNVNEFDLEFRDDMCKPLDFKIIDDAQFKDLATHIINDYFNCNSITATMTTFAHAMAAAVMSHLPLSKSPVLWINGSFSSGKSFVAEMAQNFYGNFDSMAGMNSTGKGKLLVAHAFRNALLVIDDFKGALSDHNTREMIQFIHSAYDRSGRAVSQRNGVLRENATRIRGMVVTTGEDFPSQEASAISRMLLVDVGSNGKRLEQGERVKERKHDYCGFTPHFIQFVYNMDESEVARIYHEYFNLFEQQNKAAKANDSGNRISENLALNMAAFRLAMELLFTKGVIPVQKKEEFCQMHLKNLEIIRTTIAENVRAQKGANQFLDELRGLLQDSSKYHLVNWFTYDPVEHKNSKPLGFYRERDPEVVWIYPATAHGEVNQAVKKNGSYLQVVHHIARQLAEDGHIPTGMYDPKNTRFAKHVTTPLGTRMPCWAIKLESLGLIPPGTGGKPLTRPVVMGDNVIDFASNE